MRWPFFRNDQFLEAGRKARLLHSRWLTAAIERPMDAPRIPTRRVADGGFSDMLGRPNGRQRADKWWDLALDRVPND